MQLAQHALILVFLCTAFAGQSAAKCIEPLALAQLSVGDLKTLEACDIVGAAYRGGLGIAPSVYQKFDGKPLESFKYYLPMRLYFNRKSKGLSDGFDHEFGLLLTALSFLDNHQSRRESIYRVFVLSEYWTHHSTQEKVSGFWLSAAVQEHTRKTEFYKLESVECFVRYDIPVLNVSEIVEAPLFKQCANKP